MSQQDSLKHRKTTAKITFVRNDGTPVKGKEIKFQMQKHKFLFGCGAFDAIKVAGDALSMENKQFYEDRLEKWMDIFNYGTLPFYWAIYEPDRGRPNTKELRNAASWLQEHNVKVKGHTLCWHTLAAPWLLQMKNEEILQEQMMRIEREVAAFQGFIDIWDVINEVVIMPEFDKYDNGITRICKELGRVGLIQRTFAQARKSNPQGTFILNDFNTSPKDASMIEECLAAGVKIDAIGIQSHQHQGSWGREKLYEVLERYSRFDLPIHFTENTFVSGHLMPADIEDLNDYQIPEWPTTPEGEERQARDMEEFYRILFADPHVEAITTWDINDGEWLGAPSGILRKDNSCKPAYEMLKHLVKEEWWTKENIVTDETGSVTLTGFNGVYEADIEDTKCLFTLGNQREMVIQL